MQITIPTPRNFSFRRTVLSHGWCVLPPFDFDREKWTLTRVIDIDAAKAVTIVIHAAKRGLIVETSRAVGKRASEKIVRDVRHMFRLDDDMQNFYEEMSNEPDFSWIAAEGAGRLLRSPTVFEDLVKMMCTTNCSWALTEKMVGGLVSELGHESDDGRKSFPTAAAMAEKNEKFYRDKIRAGYRAPYLAELAQRVASGELDVESWLNLDQPHEQFMKELKRVKGVGNYAAENLLKLLGRYDGLALDSWTRAQFAKSRNNGRAASDKKIARFYARFNSWRGLVLWCDMTRHWLDPENVAK
jgi:3-methyladenine DNA glycosylase/8-oxoguanine DNA glycosylase